MLNILEQQGIILFLFQQEENTNNKGFRQTEPSKQAGRGNPPKNKERILLELFVKIFNQLRDITKKRTYIIQKWAFGQIKTRKKSNKVKGTHSTAICSPLGLIVSENVARIHLVMLISCVRMSSKVLGKMENGLEKKEMNREFQWMRYTLTNLVHSILGICSQICSKGLEDLSSLNNQTRIFHRCFRSLKHHSLTLSNKETKRDISVIVIIAIPLMCVHRFLHSQVHLLASVKLMKKTIIS